MDCQNYKDIISAHVDDALSSKERWAVQTHVNQCPKCRQMYIWETQVARDLKRKLFPLEARPALKERILEQLGESRGESFWGWSYGKHGVLAAIALLLVVAVPFLFWPNGAEDNVFNHAIAQYQEVSLGGTPALQRAVSNTPTARLLDLSPWGYQILSRQSHWVGGKLGRTFVYSKGPGEAYLIAQEFEGMEISPPSGGSVVRTSNRDFVSYSQDDVNLVAWKDKDMLCILASKLPKKKLLGLAQRIAFPS